MKKLFCKDSDSFETAEVSKAFCLGVSIGTVILMAKGPDILDAGA